MKFVRDFRLTAKSLYSVVFWLALSCAAQAEMTSGPTTPRSVDEPSPSESCLKALYNLGPKPPITGSKAEIRQKKKDLRKELRIIQNEKKKTVSLDVMKVAKKVAWLRAKFEEHPDQEMAWYEDLAMRMRDYPYAAAKNKEGEDDSFEEVFAAAIMLSPRAEAAWETLLIGQGSRQNPKPINMLVSTKRHPYSLVSQIPFLKFTADRAYSSRRFFGFFRAQKFDLPQKLPPDKPGETPEFIRFMVSMADAIEKASDTSARMAAAIERARKASGRRSNPYWPLSTWVNRWPVSMLINRALDAQAFTMLGWEGTKKGINKGLKLFGYKGWTDDRVLRNFAIRFYTYNLPRRKLLLKMAWYLQDPTRFATDPPKLDPLEQVILEQEGPEALVREMLNQKGYQETVHFLNIFLPFLYAAGNYIDFLIRGAGPPQFDDLPSDNAACRTPEQTEEYAFSPIPDPDRPDHQIQQSPFLDAFIGKRIDNVSTCRAITDPALKLDCEKNPCDPNGEVAGAEEELRKKYPDPEQLSESDRAMAILPSDLRSPPKEFSDLLMKIKGVYDKDMIEAKAMKKGEVFDPQNKSCMKYLIYYFCKNPFPF